MKVNLTQTISTIVQDIQASGHKVWLVGGAIRDLLLEREPKDLDLCTDCLPSVVKLLVNGAGFIAIPDEKAFAHGIVRVVDKDTGNIIDIATLRKDVECDGRHALVEFTDNLLDDLARRDFTINAIAAEIDSSGQLWELIDPHNGKLHLSRGEIIFVGSATDRIKEDSLRMIRACRFTALGADFHIPPDQQEVMQQYANLVLIVSKERVRDELMKAISYPIPSKFFRSLEERGLLQHTIPELVPAVGCIQNVHHAAYGIICIKCNIEITTNELKILKENNWSHC